MSVYRFICNTEGHALERPALAVEDGEFCLSSVTMQAPIKSAQMVVIFVETHSLIIRVRHLIVREVRCIEIVMNWSLMEYLCVNILTLMRYTAHKIIDQSLMSPIAFQGQK